MLRPVPSNRNPQWDPNYTDTFSPVSHGCFEGIASWLAGFGSDSNSDSASPLQSTSDQIDEMVQNQTPFATLRIEGRAASDSPPASHDHEFFEKMMRLQPISFNHTVSIPEIPPLYREHISQMDPQTGILCSSGSVQKFFEDPNIEVGFTIDSVRYLGKGMGVNKCDELQGRGLGGRVFLGKSSSGKEAAIKVCYNAKNQLRHIELSRQEAYIQRLLHGKSPYIVQAQAAGECSGVTCIVMDKAEGGDLFDLVIKTPPNVNQFQYITKIAKYMLQAAEGLEVIHAHNIVHGDFKLDNVLISKGAIKITDFGLSTILPPGATYKDAVKVQGTLGYIPKELSSRRIITKKQDVFAFGVALYTAITRQQIPGFKKAVPDTDQIDWRSFRSKAGSTLATITSECFYSYEKRPSITSIKQSLMLGLQTGSIASDLVGYLPPVDANTQAAEENQHENPDLFEMDW